MGLAKLLFCLALTSATCYAQYTLQTDFFQGNFFDQFTFWDTADPTQGFVQYVDQATAQSAGLIKQNGNQVILAVDSTSTTSTGRQSVRLTSKQIYQSGLIIIDLAHMPGSICGTWPAFWTVGPDWPNQGEIDIIEGVNDNTFNAMTLHTNAGCTITDSTGTSDVFSGKVVTNDCNTYATNQPSNAGCSIDATSSNTYGNGFNAAGGGVYAMELTADAISVYFFSRGSIPANVLSDSPDPSTWGIPLSNFAGGCDFASKFTNQQIVFDVTFCGQWAGAVWPGSSCAAQFGASCEAYVGNNPSAFAQSYWAINSLKVFQDTGGSGEPTPTTSSAETTSIPTGQTTVVGSSAPVNPTTVPLPPTTPIVLPPSSGSDSSSNRPTESNAAPSGSSAPVTLTKTVTQTASFSSLPAAQSQSSVPAGSIPPTTGVPVPPPTTPPQSPPLTPSAPAPSQPQPTSAFPTPGAPAPTGGTPPQVSSPPEQSFPGGGFQSGGGRGHYPYFSHGGGFTQGGGGGGFGGGGFGGGGFGGGGFGQGGGRGELVEAQTASASQAVAQESSGPRLLHGRSNNKRSEKYELAMPEIFKRSRHLKYHRNQKHA